MFRMKFRLVVWLPAIAFLSGCLASAATAQETSEDSKCDQERAATAEALAVKGKMVISGPEGKVRVFLLKKGDGNRMVFVTGNDEQEGAAAGSEKETKQLAILVGPEGVRHEVEIEGVNGLDALGAVEASVDEPSISDVDFKSVVRFFAGDGEVSGTFGLHEPEIVATLAAEISGFMIGVSCEPVSGALASQLGLEKGLVVLSVVDEAPASGKLETHDIITHVDGNAIGEVSDLSKAVQSAGEADGELKLTVLRGGKSTELVVKPVKRESRVASLDISPESWMEGHLDGLKLIRSEIDSSEGILFESVGPGVLRREGHGDAGGRQSSADDLKAEIEALRQQIEELSGRLKNDK